MSSDHPVSAVVRPPIRSRSNFNVLLLACVLRGTFFWFVHLCALSHPDGIGRRNCCSVVGTTVLPLILGPSAASLQS